MGTEQLIGAIEKVKFHEAIVGGLLKARLGYIWCNDPKGMNQ